MRLFAKSVLVLSYCCVMAYPASAATTCAQGFVNKVQYGGNDYNSHNPWILATVNGTDIYIGMNSDSAKDRAEMSDMRATLLSALLGGISVTIQRMDGGTCKNDKSQTQNKMSVIVQSRTNP